jgi:hypothetical protein
MDVKPDLREGLVAYSEKQTSILQRMATQFANQWHPILVTNGLPVEWPSEFSLVRSDLSCPGISSDVVCDDDPLPIDDDLF